MTQMIKSQNWLSLICLVVFLLGSCAQRPVKKPIIPQPQQKPSDESRIDQTKGDLTFVDILKIEAAAYETRLEFKKALNRYDQALAAASEDEKDELIEKIESLLSKMSITDIRFFIDAQDIHIPKALLLYWYGLNAALSEHKLLAQKAFETFLFEYTDHPYAEDVADLLTTIKESLFNKNTIGVVLPLSGKYAIFGQQALDGIQMALKDLSQIYDTQFRLVIKDSKADPDTAVEGVRRLHQQNVAGIIGPWLTVSEAGREAQRLGIPMIGLTQKSEFPLQGDYLFTNFISPEMQVQTLGEYLFAELGLEKIAILYPNEKYGEIYMNLFWDVVEKYGAQVVGAESYDGGKTDFTIPIQKLTGEYFEVPEEIKKDEELRELAAREGMEPDDPAFLSLLESLLDDNDTGENEKEPPEKEKKPVEIDFQALFIPDSPSRVSLILPQLAYNDATGMYLIGTNLWHNKKLLKNARGYNKKAIITDGFFGNSSNPVTARFNEHFKKLYRKDPKFLEAIAYDCATILLSTAMDETVNTRMALKDAITRQLSYQGVTGNTYFDPEGRANRRLFLLTIKKGKFVEISH